MTLTRETDPDCRIINERRWLGVRSGCSVRFKKIDNRQRLRGRVRWSEIHGAADVKPPQEHERRRQRSRGPTPRSPVKLAPRCESAEEMGKKWKRASTVTPSARG